ncbi:LPD38 domain-containing protein [Aeromonas salmonicida]|uniref:LPD38 domain-containing protein n=1 Tax=Aeromonas salmonicida TaxID=645 RepID=UPI0035A6BD6D
MAKPTREDFIAAARARYSTQQQAPDESSEQGIFGDTVDMFQRGLGQTLGGDLETVGQIADSQGIKDAGRGVSAWADGQLQEASAPMREAMGKQFFEENVETGAIEAGDAWSDPRSWAGNFATVLGQFTGLVGGTKGAGLIARPALRGAGKLLAKDLVEGQARELVAKATVKDAIQAGALDSVKAAYLAAPGEAAKRAVLDKAIGRLTSIGYGAHAGAMASGMRAQQAEQEARGFLNGLGNDELNANPIYQQAYWDLADGEMRGAGVEEIRRAAIDGVAEKAATDAWSDKRALTADFLSGMLTGAGGGVGGLLGKVGSTRAGAAARGFVGEGATEAWQGGETQRAVNQAVQEWADETRDPMAGVLSSALNEGTIGGAFGGVVGGVRGPEAQAASKPVVRVERRVVTGDGQIDDMIHGLDQRQAERGADISGEIESMFAGERNPLGARRDPIIDIPAYQRQGFVRGSHDFKGTEIPGPLEGDLMPRDAGLMPLSDGTDVSTLGGADSTTRDLATPAGDRMPQVGQPAVTDQRLDGELVPQELPEGRAGILPGATFEGEGREVGTELPHRDFIVGEDGRPAQRRAADIQRRGRELDAQPAQIGQSDTIFMPGEPGADPRNGAYTPPRLSRDRVDRTLGEESTRDPRSPVSQAIANAGSATDSVFGPLQSLRVTKRGKPFASQKEAQLASRADEQPVALNGGGFGIANRGEVEQAKAITGSDLPAQGVSGETVTAPSQGEASQPQAEVRDARITQVPAISGDGQSDQPGTGVPTAAGAEPAIAGIADGVGAGDRADLAAPAPVPDGQQQDDQALTTPATDAGVVVSEVADPTSEPAAAPQPWAEAIDNADGTVTLKGEVPIIRKWAKDNGVKVIPGKGGLVVAKSSAAKVREFAIPNSSEPVQQIEAARADVAPAPTEAQKEAGNYRKGHLTLQGLDIALENPKGSTRSGTDQDGKTWQSNMAHDYGYIKRTLGADGDHVDVFIGDQPESEQVYVVDQVDPQTGKFDEHKVMLGFADEAAARAGYLANYEPGWKGLGTIKAMPVKAFKRWLKEGDTTQSISRAKRAAQESITDFGEKIGGARKDIWASYRDSIQGDTVDEIKELPLSKAWPTPDYQKLLDSGIQPWFVAYARAARDSIPAKPQTGWKQQRWAEAVKTMRDTALGLLEGDSSSEQLRQQIAKSGLHLAEDISNRAALYEAVGHQRSLADLKLRGGEYSLYNGVKYDPPKQMWTLERGTKSSALGNWPRIIATGDTKQETIAAFKDRYEELTAEASKPKAVAFDIYSRDDGNGWFVGKKLGRNYLDLTPAFKDVKEARTYRAEHQDELIAKLEQHKAIPRERRDLNQPRVGEDMRAGQDVTPEQFASTFGFRGVEFGNWVEQGRRQRDLNDAFDALMDMAAILGIPPKAISLNGELGLAFGARGSGGVSPAAAHYEPGKMVINLTKMNGAGSLGHEWWHALDNYFSRLRGKPGDNMTTALDVGLAAQGSNFVHRGEVRKEMVEAFGEVMRAIKQTSLKARSQKLDSRRSKAYWATDVELSARAFESYLIAKLQDQSASNDYLANIVSEAQWEAEAALGLEMDDSYPYATAGEVPAIRAGFDQLFDTLESKQEGDRTVLFSKQAMAQGDKPPKHLTHKEAELVTKGWFKQYQGASGIEVKIHATQAELEQALGLDAKDGLIRRAAFDDDSSTLHVAADTIADPKRMREILRHEVLAHYGLANVLGDGEYTKLMSRLIQSQKDPSMKPVWDWVNTHYADEDIGVQAEEVVAHLAELEQGAWGRGWDRVVALVTRALRAVGFVPDGITAAETRSLIEGLGKKLKRTGPDDSGPDGGKKFSQEAQPTRMGGARMSQVDTAADKAMEKLNLGPQPDIIDKTKANLDKLRKVERGVVKSWVDRFIKKANTEVLDALAPIKYAEEAAGITDAADSGYVAARMATGAASTMQATMLYGLPEWRDGVIQRKEGTGENDALLGIFSDLGKDLHNWLGWMAGHRAELLMEQGRENLLSEQDIAALKGLGKGKEAKFMEAKARWNRLNAATLDLAQEAGLFTAEARAEFESEWYIPFFRESDDGDVIAPFKPKGIANQNAGIKKLKGGEANTNDLLENIFTSTAKLIDASMKNMAAQKTVWNLADTGLIDVVAKPNMMDWRALKNGKDLIAIKMDGEDYMIRVNDPDLYRAMTFFDRQPFGAMVNVAAKAKRLLTAGVTASPEFMLRNFLRDSLSSWAISKDGFKPVIDSIKGVKKTLAMEGSTLDVMFSGASFLGGYVNGNDPTAMADSVRKSLRRKGMTPEQIAKYEKSIVRNAAQAKGAVADVWDKYSRYGEALENANREAVYEAAIKAGKSHAQAAFESKDLMDFSMLGAARFIQGASMVLPFFNARIQGLGKLSRELRDNPREIAKRAGMITAMSLGLLALNWDDERYEELPDWDKDANWHFFLGDQHFRIPKPFEIGVMFGTIPERMVRAMGGKDTGAQLGKAVARAIGETFALNPTPQIVKPLVESYFNYDSFRGGPIENAQDLAVKVEARYNEQTSLMMRELGETLGMSPKKLEHLLIGYTGTIGGYVMATADGLIRAAQPGESASWRADEIPLVKAVYRGTGPAKSTQHMEEFYRMLNEVNQLKRTVDQYRSEGLTDKASELLEEQGGILKSRRSLSRTQQQVRVVRNRIELIQRDRTLSAEDKRRRIDELLARRNDLVYQAVNNNRNNWE